MQRTTEYRLLGRMVAIDMTMDAMSADPRNSGLEVGNSTFQYTTIGGFKEIDRADNGDLIP